MRLRGVVVGILIGAAAAIATATHFATGEGMGTNYYNDKDWDYRYAMLASPWGVLQFSWEMKGEASWRTEA